jgi:hypothetical protein
LALNYNQAVVAIHSMDLNIVVVEQFGQQFEAVMGS